MTITTPLNYKRTSSILFNEVMNPKLSPYSAYTQSPKKRNNNNENNTDNKKSTNDHTQVIKERTTVIGCLLTHALHAPIAII